MSSAQRSKVASIANWIVAVGLIGWVGYASPAALARFVAKQVAFAHREPIQKTAQIRFVAAMEVAQAPASQASTPEHQHKSAWYKNKHWWKKNAPIVGGAAGGGLIGGLAGGGKGAIIGGAAGGGGGYLYKHLRHKSHHTEQ
jgi:hypothetical protein